MKKMMFFFLMVGGVAFGQVSEQRTVDAFSSVNVSQGIVVNFTYGSNSSVKVEAESKEVLDRIVTAVEGSGVLRVKFAQDKKKVFKTNKNVVVTITNSALQGVAASSSAQFNLLNEVKVPKPLTFKLSVSSSAKFSGGTVSANNIEITGTSSSKVAGFFEAEDLLTAKLSSSAKGDIAVKANAAEFGASSSANLKVSGIAPQTLGTASSSGTIQGRGFKTSFLEGKASSSGSMVFDVDGKVDGTASSSGRVQYIGSGQISAASTSSSGVVSKIN